MALNLKAEIQKEKDSSKQQKSDKDYSINKIMSGLRTMILDSYSSGMDSFKDNIDAIYDASVLDSLIQDFPNFESVLLLTNDVRVAHFLIDRDRN